MAELTHWERAARLLSSDASNEEDFQNLRAAGERQGLHATVDSIILGWAKTELLTAETLDEFKTLQCMVASVLQLRNRLTGKINTEAQNGIQPAASSRPQQQVVESEPRGASNYFAAEYSGTLEP